MPTTPNYAFPYQGVDDAPDGPALGEDLATAVDTALQGVDDKVGSMLVRKVTSTAGGTGVSTTETKDATGDLTFVAVSGYSYHVTYNATAIGGAAAHIIDVNIRDGGSSSPTNSSTRIAGTSAEMPGSAAAGRTNISISRTFDCPGDISAGTHKIAAFYVRNSSGATTNNVQLENAGPSRELAVLGIPTN